MDSKVHINIHSKLSNIDNELTKIDEKLNEFNSCSNQTFSSIENNLESLQNLLNKSKEFGDNDKAIATCVSSIKSKMSECTKAHRDIHLPISKFGKLVDKTFVDDHTQLSTYFNRTVKENRPNDESSGDQSQLYNVDGLFSKTSDDLLRLVIIEHLLREGLESLAVDLMNSFNFTEDDIRLNKFRELSALASATKTGEIEPARNWLSANRDKLGSKAKQLEYTLAKLEFLSTMQKDQVDPSAVIQSARNLVPFSTEYALDFEHLMGSLVFIGRSLEDTPYADLFLPVAQSTNQVAGSKVADDIDEVMRDETSSMTPPKSAQTDEANSGKNALTEAANLFKSCCCYQLNLSDVDPLLTTFSSGCRVLTRLHSLQQAIACLSKYSSLDDDMLPIAVKLDPTAHRHNIFHCPVIKEVSSESNVAIRLTCGHAISRDAFNSLVSGDRSRMKCPYCPVETYKNQILELIF